jgi:hypothetical protein
MENVNSGRNGSIDNHPSKQLGDKSITKFSGVNLAMKEFNLESRVNTRQGVIIDWSNGTMILQTNS